jgi:tripartite-type tricarboxylate transporter receptor subunit TctC
MSMSSRLRGGFAAATVSLAALLGAGAAPAQDFPNKPLRLIVAQPAGSSADILMRMVAQKLTESLGQNVLVDNRPGANGIIGMDALAKSRPDGYTIAMAAPSPMTVNQFIYKSLPYKPLEDFAPVTQTTGITFALVANPNLAAKTVGELVALAKAKPDSLNYSSPGIGNLSHLGAELLSSEAGIKMRHIPNKGDTPALLDVMSGNTDFTIITMPAALPHIRSGKLRLIATAGRTRSPVFPDVPTIAESGYPAVVIEGWSGIIAPAGTPPEVVAKLQREISKLFTLPEFKETVGKQGADVAGTTPDAFAAFIRAEAAKWARVVKTSGIQLDQ